MIQVSIFSFSFGSRRPLTKAFVDTEMSKTKIFYVWRMQVHFAKKSRLKYALKLFPQLLGGWVFGKVQKSFMQWITTNGNHILPSFPSHSYVTIILFTYLNTNAFWNHPRNILSAEEICFHSAGRSFNKGTDVHIRSVGTAYWENLSGNIFSGLIIYSYPYFFLPWLYFCIAKNFGN